MVVKTLGREGEETERFAVKARELRDVSIRAGRIRADVRPGARPPPQHRRPRGAGPRRLPGAPRPDRRRQPHHRRLPAHHRLVPDPLDRLAARRVPPQRGRASTGCTAVLDGHRRDAVRRRAPRRPVRRQARRRAPRLCLRARRAAAATTSTFGVDPGRTVAAGRGHRLRQEHAHLVADPARRPRRGSRQGRRHRPARPVPRRAGPLGVRGRPDRVPLRRHRPRQHHPRRRHPRRGRLGSPAHRPGRRLRRRPARRARHPAGGARHLALGRPAAADLAWPGRWSAGRGC